MPQQKSPTKLTAFHYFQKVSYVLCNRLYVQGRSLPSASDNTFDTVISMITNKLLTGHPDFLRYRGICMPCCFSSAPEKLKPYKKRKKIKDSKSSRDIFLEIANNRMELPGSLSQPLFVSNTSRMIFLIYLYGF